jgi:hypothetical protein
LLLNLEKTLKKGLKSDEKMRTIVFSSIQPALNPL